MRLAPPIESAISKVHVVPPGAKFAPRRAGRARLLDRPGPGARELFDQRRRAPRSHRHRRRQRARGGADRGGRQRRRVRGPRGRRQARARAVADAVPAAGDRQRCGRRVDGVRRVGHRAGGDAGRHADDDLRRRDRQVRVDARHRQPVADAHLVQAGAAMDGGGERAVVRHHLLLHGGAGRRGGHGAHGAPHRAASGHGITGTVPRARRFGRRRRRSARADAADGDRPLRLHDSRRRHRVRQRDARRVREPLLRGLRADAGEAADLPGQRQPRVRDQRRRPVPPGVRAARERRRRRRRALVLVRLGRHPLRRARHGEDRPRAGRLAGGGSDRQQPAVDDRLWAPAAAFVGRP